MEYYILKHCATYLQTPECSSKVKIKKNIQNFLSDTDTQI
jgi:hypothetical protein